jgi:hypothetical protein
LGGLIRRRKKVEPATLFVGTHDFYHIEIAASDRPNRFSVARHHIDVVPAVPLAQPGEALASVEPGDVIHQLHPGSVPLREDRSDRSAASVPQQHLVGVLQPV